MVTLLVDELDELVSRVAERGVAVGAIDTAPRLFRKMVVVDPEGSMIA